jgi:hypothetical protein
MPFRFDLNAHEQERCFAIIGRPWRFSPKAGRSIRQPRRSVLFQTPASAIPSFPGIPGFATRDFYKIPKHVGHWVAPFAELSRSYAGILGSSDFQPLVRLESTPFASEPTLLPSAW